MSSISSTTTPSEGDQQVRRKIKAHRKSRSGCFTCKGRRVKCCETRPRCTSCTRSNLQCIYPEAVPTTLSIRSGQIQYQTRGFSLRDMRFFHDFMTVSHPHMPLNCEHAWTNDIPLIAQQHEFLMHAVLALGAAHLHAKTSMDFENTVQRHRGLAMQGLLDSNETTDESKLNAQLAATYALNFVAAHMGDPLSSSMVLARAGANFNNEIVKRGYTSPLFLEGHDMSKPEHYQDMERRLRDKPGDINRYEVDRAKASLQYFARVCTFTESEWGLFTALRGVLDEVEYAICAYRNLISLWGLLTDMSASDFEHFTSPTNITGIVMQAHFLALEEVLRPWLFKDAGKGLLSYSAQMENAFANLPPLPEDAPPGLLDWPRAVSNYSEESMTMRGVVPGVTWKSQMMAPAGSIYQQTLYQGNRDLLKIDTARYCGGKGQFPGNEGYPAERRLGVHLF